MFGLYFCYYLLEKNKISQSEFEELLLQLQKTRAKLGFIATTEKLLTTKQAEEINEFQKTIDRRFGDIAIEKGYLLKEEVTYLLNLQGNSYLRLVKLLTEKHILTMREIEELLAKYKTEYNLSDYDIDSLKSDDIDHIIPVFIDFNMPILGEFISLIFRNIVRFISNDIIIKKAYRADKYTCPALVFQRMVGTHNIFIGFAGDEASLVSFADLYGNKHFPALDEDAFHSISNFINCCNSLYASKLSCTDTQIDIVPPEYSIHGTLTTTTQLFIIPFLIHGEQVDLILCIDDQVAVNN